MCNWNQIQNSDIIFFEKITKYVFPISNGLIKCVILIMTLKIFNFMNEILLSNKNIINFTLP